MWISGIVKKTTNTRSTSSLNAWMSKFRWYFSNINTCCCYVKQTVCGNACSGLGWSTFYKSHRFYLHASYSYFLLLIFLIANVKNMHQGVCVRDFTLWINVAQGYPCAPLQINHSDTFTTLLIRQGPQSTPLHLPRLCCLAPLFGPLSQEIGKQKWGWTWDRGMVCVGKMGGTDRKWHPHSECSWGTGPGTRLLSQFRQRSPPCSTKACPACYP